MRRFTKLVGAAMSASLMLGAAPQVAMAGTITVTTENPTEDTDLTHEVYTCYKIFSATKNSAGTGVTYKIAQNDPWFSVLFNGTAPVSGNDWFTLRAIPGEGTAQNPVYQVIPDASFDSSATDAARTCADWLMEHKPDSITGTTLNNNASNTVDDGYYLVSSSRGSNLGLATTDIADMEIIEKNTYPSIDKTQQDGENASAAYTNSSIDLQIGDTVNYQIVVTVPASVNQDIVITDVMTAGLTPAAASTVQIATGSYADTTFTAAEGTLVKDETGAVHDWNVTGDATGYVITLHPTDAIKGKTIQLTFSATVDSDAVTDFAKNNTATLTYSHYSQTDVVNYKTYATGMVKFDGATGTLDTATNTLSDGTTYLASAEFELLDADGTTVIPVSYDSTGGYYYPDANGTAKITSVDNATGIVIRGLDNQDYFLKETKAPNGYNLLTANSRLVVANNDGDNAVATLTAPSIVKIQNNAGSILPITGGIGTVIFYAVGGTLIIGGAVALIVKSRSKKNE